MRGWAWLPVCVGLWGLALIPWRSEIDAMLSETSGAPGAASLISSTDSAPPVPEMPPAILPVPKPADAFPEMVARPLFHPSRRPPADAVPEKIEPPSTLVGYRLTGIVRSAAKRMILLQEVASGRVVELGEGESLDGWTVTRIGEDGVFLRSGDREIDLSRGSDEARRGSPDQTTGGPPTQRRTKWLPSGG